MKQILDAVEKKMDKVLDNLEANLRTIRTGRANANMLERVSVEYYGSPTPINQISSIQVVEGRQLLVKPYDRSILKEITRSALPIWGWCRRMTVRSSASMCRL